MTPQRPPLTLESLLIRLLAPRDRDSIPGDLHEAYAEKAVRHGKFWANLWYARQMLSLTPRTLTGTRSALAAVCVFSCMAGAWLGTMDLILQHPGYARRELIAGTIVTQALLTLAAVLLPHATRLRPFALLGCVPILGLVEMAISGVVHGVAVEGYILLIALTLAVQAVLTWVVLLRRRERSIAGRS